MIDSRIMGGMRVVGVLVGLLTWSGVADAKKPTPPGKQGKFVVLGTGQVLDTTTSLRWQQKPGDPTDDTCGTNLPCTWTEAWAYCEGLGNGARLPGIKELQGLVDYSEDLAVVALNTPNGPFTGVVPGNYWSATTKGDDPTEAWYVDFSFGQVRFFGKDSGSLRAWCVRGAQAFDGQNIVVP